MLDLSYLGWAILAALPDTLYRSGIQIQVQGIVGGALYWNLQDVLEYVDPNLFGMPWIAWQALITVWALVVSVYYRAHYQCVELAYFDTAKRCSGVGEVSTDFASYGADDGQAPYDGGESYRGAYGGDNGDSGGYDGEPHSGSYGGNDNSGNYGNEP